MKWNYDDNFDFCKQAIEIYYKNNEDMKASEFIEQINKNNRFNNFSKNSLRRKLANTKFLFRKYNIKNTIDIAELDHYSKDHEKAFKEIMKI